MEDVVMSELSPELSDDLNDMLRHYQWESRRTFRDIPCNHELVYVSLGFANEIGELNSVVDIYNRSDTISNKNNIIDEFGDVMWYFTQMTTSLDCSLYAIAANSHNVEPYGVRMRNIHTLMCSFNITCGLILGEIKRIFRDDNPECNEEPVPYAVIPVARREALYKLFLKFWFYARCLAKYIEVSLKQVLDHNLTKVLSRLERGVIEGAGSDR